MRTAAPEAVSGVEVFRDQARITAGIVHLNVAGVTQSESLFQPRPAGNCLNWVVGHLVWVYELTLPSLGEELVLAVGALERYARGGAPLSDAAEALDLDELMGAWDEASRRIDAGLLRLTAAALDAPAADYPGAGPDDTVRSHLSGILFHQAYHAGQLGTLRRLIGKEGAFS
jgi:hypothetical protein